jgi:hypothetical protein
MRLLDKDQQKSVVQAVLSLTTCSLVDIGLVFTTSSLKSAAIAGLGQGLQYVTEELTEKLIEASRTLEGHHAAKAIEGMSISFSTSCHSPTGCYYKCGTCKGPFRDSYTPATTESSYGTRTAGKINESGFILGWLCNFTSSDIGCRKLRRTSQMKHLALTRSFHF